MLSLFLPVFLVLGLAAGASVPTPDNDPFYKPPSGFESSAPGTIFKNRTAPSGILGVTAVQVLYRTTNINGSATATVATILTGPKSTGDKLVSYADPEDSDNTTCADSYLYNSGSTLTSLVGIDVPLVLNKGWTVMVSDYEGPGSAFSAGRLAGYAILDGLRAALNYAPAGISKSAKIGGYGYSGGAIATGWAASLHHTYAPELNVVGWAFGGTPSNVTSTLQNVEGTLFAGFAVAGVAGQIAAYPALEARFAEIVTADGQAAIAKVRSQCSGGDLLDFVFANLETTKYQTLGSQLLYDPVVASILVNGTMGVNANETPVAPVYMFHGKSDEVIPYASAQKTANAWCSNGASVEFVTETGGTGHVGTSLALFSNATGWLDLRLSGTPATGCSNVSFFELGIPLKRDEVGVTAIQQFGVADKNVTDDMEARIANGQSIPNLWSYASSM